jgi:CRISPR-associated protein Csb2
MTVLELSFPAGRYHATPWGRHVNEGAIEWPPSPWRIVRALIATWYLKARPEIPEATVRSLVNALSEPPTFRLPAASTGHTRHYMPYNEGKNEKTTKVFDTFIQLPENGTVIVVWDVALSPDERAALQTLASRLGYFGRAESLVLARVLDELTEASAKTHWISSPLTDGATLTERIELVRLLAPMTPAQYGTWSSDFMAKAEAALGPKPTAAQKKKPTKVPDGLFAALHADTGELQSAGWNLPPGARHVNYTRREDAFAPVARPLSRSKGPMPTVARYAVVSTVPPSITKTVSVADRVHDALCKWSDQGKGRASVFTGLNENGKPCTDHRHAQIFCEANGPRDAISHITVCAEMGFDEAACLALRRLNKVWGHGGHDIRLVLYGIGQAGDFQDCALFGLSKVWRSVTPFVSTRHAKSFRDGRPKMDDNGWQEGSAAHDLLRLLHLRAKWKGAKIRRQLAEREGPFEFGSEAGKRKLRSLQFQTIRHDGAGSRGHDNGSAFVIEFSGPVSGPIAVGYGAHFGLGLFAPMD